MLLYPQLPQKVARTMAEKQSSMSIESLSLLSSIAHPAAIYAPTGGYRASENDLQKIYKRIRECAGDFGYPALVGDLKMRNFDASSGQILLEEMNIAPSEASNLGVWAFTTCVLWPDIVRWRFPGSTDGTSKERFVGGRRNTFGRVWWRAYLLKEPKSDHPYELLDLLGEDELVQITERPSVAGSATLVKEICKTYLRITADVSTDIPGSRLILRETMKRLRRLLPIVSFDALDDQTLRGLINEFFNSSIESLREK